MSLQKDHQLQMSKLREENDAVVSKYERDMAYLRSQQGQHDFDYRASEKQYKDKLDSELKDHGSAKLRIAFLETNQEKLQSEIAKVKATYEDALSDSLKEIESLMSSVASSKVHASRLQKSFDDSTKKLQLAESKIKLESHRVQQLELEAGTLKHESERARKLDSELTVCKSDLKMRDEEFKSASQELSETHNLCIKLENAVSDRETDLKRCKADLVIATERCVKIEDDLRRQLESDVRRLQDEVHGLKQNFAVEKSRLEQIIKTLERDVVSREQEYMDERNRILEETDREIRGVAHQEQKRARDMVDIKLGEMRFKYDQLLENATTQRRKVEAALDEAERCINDERDRAHHQSIASIEKEKAMIEEIKCKK
jgi:chromosome segregation ATPase